MAKTFVSIPGILEKRVIHAEACMTLFLKISPLYFQDIMHPRILPKVNNPVTVHQQIPLRATNSTKIQQATTIPAITMTMLHTKQEINISQEPSLITTHTIAQTIATMIIMVVDMMLMGITMGTGMALRIRMPPMDLTHMVRVMQVNRMGRYGTVIVLVSVQRDSRRLLPKGILGWKKGEGEDRHQELVEEMMHTRFQTMRGCQKNQGKEEEEGPLKLDPTGVAEEEYLGPIEGHTMEATGEIILMQGDNMRTQITGEDLHRYLQ